VANWTVAVPAADEAARLAAEIGDPVWGAGALAMKAMLAALRGDPDTAASLSLEAAGAVVPIGASFMIAIVQEARGLTALAQGRHQQAYDELRRIYDRADSAYHRPLCYWYAGDYAEASVNSGHAEAARTVLDELMRDIDEIPGSWIDASVLYSRAQLADDSVAGELYRSALGSGSRWPFQRARFQLAYGVWLRRQRRVAESRAPLRAASDAFEALGTVMWAERAHQELRAAGEVSRGRSLEKWGTLTPQEIQIASMAAEGLSNREIGRKLYLSHRTVGSHLYRIFPKLGITSRGQLRNVVATP
jgi:DNA-binding CsgD family transcriptional regulator